MPNENDEFLDVVKLCGMVNSEGNRTNEALVEGRDKMGFKRIIPKFETLFRKTPNADELQNIQVPNDINLIPMLPVPTTNNTAPIVQQPTISKEQKEFSFVETLSKIPNTESVLTEMLASLRNIEYKLDIFNKNNSEILKNLPKKRIKN